MKVPVGPAAVLAGLVARGLPLTWRYRVLGERGRARTPRPLRHAIYALWHEHLLPLSLLHRGQGAAALVSRHRDGEILARVLESMGYVAVRGSSSRGGTAGLREMVRLGREGRPLAFTPDGPRGPARRCQPGVVRAAVRSGLPIVPAAAEASRTWRLESWDRFMVPLPATTVYVAYGDPLLPGEREIETWARKLGRRIDAVAARCARAAGAAEG